LLLSKGRRRSRRRKEGRGDKRTRRGEGNRRFEIFNSNSMGRGQGPNTADSFIGEGKGPTQRIRSSAASLVSLPRTRFAMRASCIPLTLIIPISHCKTVCCLNILAVGNPSHLLCILRVELDVGLGGGWG